MLAAPDDRSPGLELAPFRLGVVVGGGGGKTTGLLNRIEYKDEDEGSALDIDADDEEEEEAERGMLPNIIELFGLELG